MADSNAATGRLLLPDLGPVVSLSVAGGRHRAQEAQPVGPAHHPNSGGGSGQHYEEEWPAETPGGAEAAAVEEEEWGEYVDESTGIPYYFEHRSGRSSWEAPAAWRRLSHALTAISRPTSSQQASSSSSSPSSVSQQRLPAGGVHALLRARGGRAGHGLPSIRSGSPGMSPTRDKPTARALPAPESGGGAHAGEQLQQRQQQQAKKKKKQSGGALSRFRAAAKKVSMAQRFFGEHCVQPMDTRKTADYQNAANGVVDREERNRYARQLGILHPAVIKHYDDQHQKLVDRAAAVERLNAEAAKLEEKMNDATMAEAERDRLRSLPGVVTVTMLGGGGWGEPGSGLGDGGGGDGASSPRTFDSLDKALAAVPPPPARAVVSLGTGTYTFTDRPLLLEKDVTLTRTSGCWVKVVFRSTRLQRAEVAALMRMTPRPRHAAATEGVDAEYQRALDADDAKLRSVPCMQLRHRGAKLERLRIHTDLQCAVLVTAPAAVVTQCTLHGGGLVVRTARRAKPTEAALVCVEENKVFGACNDGIVCEGRGTRCQVVGNHVQGADGYGVWVRLGACPSVRDNEVTANHGDGVGVWHPQSAPTIASNRILRNEGNGLTIAQAANPLVKDNDLCDNGYAGVWVRERGRGRIELNRILRNGLGPIKAAPADGCNCVTRRNQGVISVIGRERDIPAFDDHDAADGDGGLF